MAGIREEGYFRSKSAMVESHNIIDGTMTELWNSRTKTNPEELLLSLSKDCAKLGVNTFDVYGDFDQSPDNSYLRRFEREVSAAFGKDEVS